MAGLRNPGFEQPGIVPGDALGWRMETVSTAIAWAEFGASTLDDTVDGYESGWNNDSAAALGDVVYAIFDQAGEPALVDDFERGWQSNENIIPDLESMPIQDATFDQAGQPGPRDDFERGWSGNEDIIEDLGDMPVQDAAFGDSPAPQPREQFDQQWAGVSGEMKPLMLFLFTQQVDFIKGVPDIISLDPPGDFLISGVRPGATINITGASATNNGIHTVLSVTSTIITLTSSNALQNQNDVIAGIGDIINAKFDGQNYETMEFAWNAMSEDF